MFDNLIESINSQLPLSDESKQLLNAVAQTPDLSYFGSDQKTKSDSRLLTQELNKASLLRLLRTCYLCPSTNSNFPECKKVYDAIIQKNSLSKILTQLSDFQFIVGVETIIALQSHKPDVIFTDEAYQTNLIKTANSAPKHLRPLYCFAILQLLGLRNLYSNPSDKVKKLPSSANDILTRKIFLPILFASFLNPEDSKTINNILRQYDIFSIVLHKWIERMSKILLGEVKKICMKEIFYFLSRFLRLYSQSLMNGQNSSTISRVILPLMSRVVCDYPKLFDKLMADFNVLSNKEMTETHFPSILQFLANSCNSRQNSLTIVKIFSNCQNRSEPLMKQFFDCLTKSHLDIISKDVDEYSKSSLLLLKNFLKYLPNELKEKMILMFKGDLPKDFQEDLPENSLAAFLWDFMENSELAPIAAKALLYLSALRPECVYQFFSNPSDFSKVESIMFLNADIAKSFVKIARNMVSFSFCIKSRLTNSLTSAGIPLFAQYLVTEYFTSSIFKKFERRTKRWSTLKSILETALDITYCDPSFCNKLSNEENFVQGLISIVHQTASILSEPSSVTQESDSVRIDSDNFRSIIQFDSISMTLMIRLITYNLIKNKEEKEDLAYMCKSFFIDESGDSSSLFTTFVSFLKLSHPLSSQLRYYSVKMLDLMCEIAGRMPSINVDSFYPHESQRVLKEMIYSNLFKFNDVTQIITQLDFIAHTLSSQLSFAYSFVHHLGSSFVIAAVSKIEKFASEYPDLLYSLSHLLSMMFQKLSIESTVIKQISGKQEFWTSIWNIIKMDLPSQFTVEQKCDLIYSKAELLNVAILNNSKISKDIITSLFNQLNQVLPSSFEPIYHDYEIDISRFVSVELHRVYGSNFYIDVDLLRRYLIDDNNFIEKAKRFNESMSIIHSCTQLLSTINSLLRSTDDESLIPPIKDSLRLLNKVVHNNIFYDSSIEVFFNLVDVCLTSISSPINEIDDNLLNGITEYIKIHPLESTFSIIAKFLSSTEITNLDELLLMLEPCIDYCLESIEYNKEISASALNCACEIALKLSQRDGWILQSPKSYKSFFVLLNSSLGAAAIEFMTIILMNQVNANILEQLEFFDKLSFIDTYESDAHSPLWFYLFNMMTAIPSSSKIPYYFVTCHLSKMKQLLEQDENTFVISKEGQLDEEDPSADKNKLVHVNSSSEALKLYKTQLSIMELISKIAPNLVEFAEIRDPAQHQMLLEIVSEKLRKSYLFLKECSQLKMSNGGFNKFDKDSYNEKTCNLLIIRYCLIFFNSLFEFPTGDPQIVMKSSTSSNPVLDLMDKVGEAMKEMLVNDAGIFNEYCVESFEYSMRIYCAKMFTTASMDGGRKQIKETMESVLKSIKAVKDSMKKYKIDNQESYELFDLIIGFITDMAEKSK